MNNDINSLISLLEKSVSPYHCADEAMRLLKEKGFIELEQSREWKLERGMNYYVKCFGTMLIAFHVGSGYVPGEGFRLAASHTDWRRLSEAQHRALWRNDTQHMDGQAA